MADKKESNIILSTNDINKKYKVVDVVFAIVKIPLSTKIPLSARGFLSGPTAVMSEGSMEKVNDRLKKNALKKGCDAVLWINYSFITVTNTPKVLAYGTGVKFTSSNKLFKQE